MKTVFVVLAVFAFVLIFMNDALAQRSGRAIAEAEEAIGAIGKESNETFGTSLDVISSDPICSSNDTNLNKDSLESESEADPDCDCSSDEDSFEKQSEESPPPEPE